ncbi:MAG: tetratricopeptide repeat protein [Verrucomicrobiae bacterium]|nr:tetratricopeptide repeat protein [Verrucomicrobiae bacterium]NNJ43910.1 tetratricopeptide repeat protein [Akkermansiaceae bacterium]
MTIPTHANPRDSFAIRTVHRSSGKKIWILGTSLGLVLLSSLVIPASAATFEEQRKTVTASIGTQSEDAIISLLKAGIKEGKPTQAIAETQKWLRQNLPENGMLLYYAGQAAELSGDWKSAVAIYQQYLKKADLKSATADDAVQSVYSLLIYQLKDESGAYAFGRNDGNRVMVCPRAHQFDAWFLDKAVLRKDPIAVSARLHACIKAGLSTELLQVEYRNYFNWLLKQVDTAIELPVSVNAELVTNYRKLSKAMTFNQEMALRLDWAVSVKGYNQGKLAGKMISPPVAEAKALLVKYPQYAQWVQTGWAGGSRGRHYRGDPAKYWPDEIDAKMAPIVAAIPRLTPLQLADLLQSWSNGYYANNSVIPHQVKAVRDYLKANSKVMKSRVGVLLLEKPWNRVTPQEAQKLAPSLAQNLNPKASLIRAIAAGGTDKDFNKMITALLGPEAWRLGAVELDGRYADQLWHYAGRPGGNKTRDQKIKESKAFAVKIKAAALDSKAAPNQRIALFKKLWADYRSKQPKTPAVYAQLKAITLMTPEAIPELLKDTSPEAQRLARNAITTGISGSDPIWKEIEAANKVNVTKYAPGILYLAQRHRGMAELKKRYPAKCKPHPLEAAMRKSIADGLKANKIESWKVMAWINMQYPDDNAEQIKLIQALVKSPLWKTMPFELQNAAYEWFKKDVMTPAQIAIVNSTDPAIACKDLLALPQKAVVAPKKGNPAEIIAPQTDVATAVAALTKAIEAIKKSPTRMEVWASNQVGALDPAVFSDPQVFSLIVDLIELNVMPASGDAFPRSLLTAVKKKQDPVVIHKVAYTLWESVRVMRHQYILPQTLTFAQSLEDTQPSAAYAMAVTGQIVFPDPANGRKVDPARDTRRLKTLRSKAAMNMGLMVIPVAKNNPTYPIYKSQGDWLTGNEDSAWELCDENWEQLIPIHRDLNVSYLNWVLQRVIYSRDEIRQEEFVKVLLNWAAEPTSPLTPEEKIGIELAYGDIAMQRGQLREAHQIYSKTQGNKAYEGVVARYQSTLRKADAERIGKDFDAALKTLGLLELERIPEMWSPARYARAVVYYDMEEYDDSADDIESILAREPNHGEAKILLGKVQLKRKKLMEATEIEVTPGSSQTTLVPGEKLKVTLVDPTLAVSGAGTEIEVVVWAKSGDKETFFLRQFGDQKTKFRGEVATALGAPKEGDRILQVIGDDEVFYAYSERFRKKMNNMPEKRGGPITIASNSTLMASSRKLLTEDEQRIADMEKQMEAMEGKNRDATEAELANLAKVERAAAAGRKLVTGEGGASEKKEKESPVETRVKPGSPIHVRVIDPDRSRTAGIDELSVSVASSSGDFISRITLKETDTHSGWFEGSVPTAGAQAMAFAQHSEPGRNPNMVLSPETSYPAWQPVIVKGKTPEFNVDLNDNVELGEMTINANEQGSKLKKWMLLTGMNPREMIPVAAYPKNQLTLKNPWQPSVTVMNDTDKLHASSKGRKEFDLREMSEHLNRGWLSQKYAQGVSANVAGASEALTKSLYQSINWKRQNNHNVSSVIYRFQGYFYEPTEVKRQFRLELGKFKIPPKTHSSINHKPKFMLAVDGRPITSKSGGRLEGSINLSPGVHRFEIWAAGWVANLGFGRGVKLLTNLKGDEALVDCPDSFFDPSQFPKGVLAHRNATASISANDAGTEFKVKFAPESRARLFKLVFFKSEGPIPALNKLSLATPDGKKVLPVAEDYAKLNKNNTLEILTGDKISVRYVDDRFVTKSFEKRERFLQVAFSTAKVEFADIKPRYSSKDKKDMPYYEKLLRFPYGQPLSLVVNDADMDISVEPDTLKITVQSEAGGNREFIATETGPSTGVFEAIMTPVPTPVSGKDEIQVAEGGTLTATYRDQENTEPGVPTDRYATIGHAAFTLPQLSLSQPTVTAIDFSTNAEDLPGYRSLAEGFIPMDEWQRRVETDSARKAREAGRGLIQPSWSISHKLFPTTKPPEGGFQSVHGRRMYIELLAPQFALGTSSTIAVYAQTDSGRKLAQVPLDSKVFDLNVPGTIELIGHLTPPSGAYGDKWRGTPQIESYTENNHKLWSSNAALDRFTMDVPLIAGHQPNHGILSSDERYELIQKARNGELPYEEYSKLKVAGLIVLPGEHVHIGTQYKDQSGASQWLTTTTKVVTHPVFDVMENDFRVARTSAYVGETISLRVVDLGGDVSDKNDTVSVLMQAKSGAKHRVELRESTSHSGIFKGSYSLSYLKALDVSDPASKSADPADPASKPAQHNVHRDGFPVLYDDVVAMRYTASNGLKSPTRMITISKGSDGTIKPFSKKYDDPEIAMRTQFSLAESYLELAKSHRKLGKAEMAAREYVRAKQLLAKAMDQFKDPETRSHAEYLLGNLSLEEANDTQDLEIKETRYRAALSRFMNVVGTYPNTLHASKAQYRIASVYEKLKQPDIAAQEYVKLAYKYPDSEYLATAMAKLGSYFLRSAATYEREAKQLLADVDNKDAQFKGAAKQVLAEREYIKTAQIFGRLQQRFPSDPLAGKAGIRAGQAYMRAKKHNEALAAFLHVVNDHAYDGKTLRSQGMYWAGMCYQSLRQPMAAYSIYKRLTYDFPESKWAAYARGQLSQGALQKLENELEIERLEQGR